MFPFIFQEDGLNDRDFVLFELQFTNTVRYFLPAESVHFVPACRFVNAEAGCAGSEGDDDMPEMWQTAITLMDKKKQPILSGDGNMLFLPIWRDEKIAAAAVLTGDSRVRYNDYSLEWLHERSRLVSREFRRTKQWAFDPESGLLNGQNLREDLSILLQILQKSVDSGESAEIGYWSMFMLEIFPKARNSGQAGADIARAGICLKSFFGATVAIHHFGSGLFGILWRSEDSSEFRKLGYALLAKLKRQNFAKVHIGIAPLTAKDELIYDSADTILAASWSSLKDAEGRGPFALCAGDGGRAAQLLCPPSSNLKTEFGRLWRGVATFSVVLFKADNHKGQGGISKRVCSLVGDDATILPENGREAYLYLPNMGADEALLWLARFKEKISGLGVGTFSMGVASFPCQGFKRKVDIPINARKALNHTSFFGDDSLTIFDGVSLNISGDVYYNEGDLAGAVREYRHGLRFDPDNINLLNSLAVIYAQVNRYSMAINLFDKVLVIDPQDFMALFNLGFAYLHREDLQEATRYFERALAVDSQYYDLLFQLGRIYCRLGRFAEARKLLLKAEKIGLAEVSNAAVMPWHRSELPERVDADIGDGLIFRYLGKAYQGICKNRDAITYFQKAITYDPRDAEALSRLGELYLIEQQGDDIALSFCQQAINIEEDIAGHWYRLAIVQDSMNKTTEALFSLRHCLALDHKQLEALLLLAKVYGGMGKKQQVIRTYERVLRIDSTNKTALKNIKRR